MIDITITPDSVDAKAQSSDGAFDRVVILAFVAFIVFKLFTYIPDLLYSLHHQPLKTYTYSAAVSAIFLCIVVGAVFIFIRGFFPSGSALHCDRETLTISKIPTSNFHGRWVSDSFSVSSVVALQFALVGAGSFYRPVMGITFRVSGKKYKVFYGLETPEASQILDGLQKLGVDVVRDPGMPMAVEMVLERRKSGLSKLIG